MCMMKHLPWQEDIMKTYEEKKRDLYEKMKGIYKRRYLYCFFGRRGQQSSFNAGKGMYTAV